VTPGGRTGTGTTTTRGRAAPGRSAPNGRSLDRPSPDRSRQRTTRPRTTWGLGEEDDPSPSGPARPARPARRRTGGARSGRAGQVGRTGLGQKWAAGRRRPGPLARRLADAGIGVDVPGGGRAGDRGRGRSRPRHRLRTPAERLRDRRLRRARARRARTKTTTPGTGGGAGDRAGRRSAAKRRGRGRGRDLRAAPGLLRLLLPGPSTIRRSRRAAARRARSSRVSARRRSITLLCVFGLLFLVVVVRLADVQVARSGRYVSYGEAQRIEPITLPAARGGLFDRNGDELAISMPTQSVFADPHLIANPVTAARRLAPVLQVDEAELRDQLRLDGEFVYLARQVDDDVAAQVADLDIEGISFIEEPKRYYPGGDLARSLLGGVDVDGGGVSGLELRYHDELEGTPGELIREVDPDGNTIPAGRQHVDPAEPGDDLVLTIDRAMQYETEKILARHVERTGSKGGVAIISDPETGEVLTLANVQRDPTTGAVANAGEDLAVTANFEPGSVNKVITMAAALEEGVVTPETVLSVPDSLRVADHTFGDSHSHPTEDYTVTRIMAESSNIGTIKIAQLLGADRIDEYLRRFGFGEKTALDLPHENSGQLLPADEWWGTSIGSIPIGQGISVTAMQLLYAYNTIANDGVYRPPTLLSATVDQDGDEVPAQRADGRRVVSPHTAAQVRAMLAQVVADGTGTEAAIPGYEVAGKTGTARKPQEGGGYTDANGNYHHVATFAGLAPAADPQLSIIVVMDEPGTSPYAGTVAAPAFAEIGRYALRHMQVAPATPIGTTAEGQRVRSAATPGPTPPTTAATTTTTAEPVGNATTSTVASGATTTTEVGAPTGAPTTTTTAGARQQAAPATTSPPPAGGPSAPPPGG
jgi:cell division protein FtsI (penicillin-binding protein 3)